MNTYHSPYRLSVALAALLISALPRASAESIVFPESAQVVDVTKPPYGAVGDGKSDATEAIQRALDDHPSGNRIVYLPNGTYLVSKQLRWAPSEKEKSDSGKDHKRTILQGQSREGTVIRLADRSPGFQEPTKDRKGRPVGIGVVWTGTAPAQRFRNAVRNLTVHTGSGNPAACGIQFNTSNQGTIRQVSIVSGDGAGLRGLDLAYTGEIGPALVQDLRVSGFEYGIYSDALNSVTLDRVTLENQRVAGIYNRGQVLSIRGLASTNTVPAIVSTISHACIALLDAKLAGGAASAAAIVNEGVLYARNVEVAGYGTNIKVEGEGGTPPASGGNIAEYCSQEVTRLFPSQGMSLKLPIKDSPDIAWETDFSKWASPLDYGADGTGKSDDTAAVQAAIDDPSKTVLYFPGGMQFRIDGDLIVRGTIARIVGCEGRLTGIDKAGKGRIVFRDGSAPAVILERIDAMYSGIELVNEASRSVTVSSCSGFGQTTSTGSGDFFIEDLTGSVTLANPKQHVWMRQINPEGKSGFDLDNQGATLWMLGLKTERETTKVRTAKGGRTEILGAHIYSTNPGPMPNPLMVIDNATATFAAVRETSFGKNTPYDIYVRETRGSETKELKRTEVYKKRFLPLFVGGAPAR